MQRFSQKKIADKIIELWNNKDKEGARKCWRDNKPGLSSKVAEFFRWRLEVKDPEIISEEIKNAQKIMGGKIINQYGEEYQKENQERKIRVRNTKRNIRLPGEQASLFLEGELHRPV